MPKSSVKQLTMKEWKNAINKLILLRTLRSSSRSLILDLWSMIYTFGKYFLGWYVSRFVRCFFSDRVKLFVVIKFGLHEFSFNFYTREDLINTIYGKKIWFSILRYLVWSVNLFLKNSGLEWWLFLRLFCAVDTKLKLQLWFGSSFNQVFDVNNFVK